eukprot:CAMPEP_0180004686 /NCGR_PEP_ID=MMETSP0984-20121128/12253_1 /TAXON_ID=483367 /ORGANISM="non described non described, Strain CCMP 2436" /LENGTH=327 /DNA_ID=CAMNT_0021925265 /DNA_START=14 /DNA_END=993 /DNA_ORIENTATION=+
MASPVRRVTTHGDSFVRSVRWNHNNMVLASSSDDGSVCLGSESGTRDLMAAEREQGSDAVSLALSFSARSRFLAAGGDDGVVRVWDLAQSGRPRRVHAHNSAVSCVCWAPGEDAASLPDEPLLLTAGSELGEITTHVVTDGRPPACASRLVLSSAGASPVACTAVQYSPLRHALLAGADSSGVVRLWDLAATREGEAPLAAHEFTEHDAACTGLAWSTVNHLLLASVGADGKLAFYDTAQHKTVKRVTLGEPLSCVSFLADGVTIATGTLRGAIHVFDLRMSLAPVRSAVASDECAVMDLCFQHVPSPAAVDSERPRERIHEARNEP